MKKFIYTLLIIFSVVAVYAQPKITSFSPMSGAVGATVEINGTGFNSTLGNNVVYFGPVKATVTNATATKLTVTVPTGGGSGPIQVIDVANNQLDRMEQPFSIAFAESSTPVSNSFFFDAASHEFSVTASSHGTSYSSPFNQVASSDFDGDGKPDFVKANGNVGSGKGADVYLNQSSGPGNFAFASDYNLPSTLNIGSVAIGDFNMDGKMDIAIGAQVSSNAISIFRNSSTIGSLNFNTGSPTTVNAGSVARLRVADINVDGKPDLIYGRTYNSSYSYVLNTSPGDGSITFGAPQILINGFSGSRGLAIGDLDGDGASDVAAFTSSTTYMATNNNSGSSPPMNTSFSHTSSASAGFDSYIIDMNQDGKNDIIRSALNSDGPDILQNNYTSGSLNSSHFATNWTGEIGNGSRQGIVICDMNGDGKIDLVKTTSSSASLATNHMNAAATIDNTSASFSDIYISTSGFTQRSQSTVGDFDGDGKNDVLVHKGEASSNIIRIFENQVGEIKYYSKSSGSLSNLSTWGVASDGTGTNPTDFMGEEEFVLANRASYTLTSDMTVNKLTLESNKTIDLSIYNLTANQISGAGVGSFIKTSSTGRLSMTIANGETATFEVGNSAYNPVSITNNTGSSDDFEVKVIDEVYQDGTSSGPTVTGPRVQRTWDIDKTNTNGGSGVDFTFNWNGGEAVNLVTPALYHYGSDWEKVAGSPTTDGNSMTYTGYTGSFSPFTVGDAATPLPVELISFDATLEDRNNVMLTWSTAIELNNSHFEVHRSQDGLEWRKIDITHLTSGVYFVKVFEGEQMSVIRLMKN